MHICNEGVNLGTEDLKDSILDIMWIVKTSLTTIWFWVPIFFGLYTMIQMWMFVFLHPLTLLILPTIVCVYAVIDEEKRAKSQYNLSKTKILNASDPIGHGPRHISTWNVEQRVEEYLDVLEKKKK